MANNCAALEKSIKEEQTLIIKFRKTGMAGEENDFLKIFFL